jgi:hypothetical protein
VYLNDVDDSVNLSKSRWFTRGWTLQELIAPKRLKFYSAIWEELGSKRHMAQRVADITSIPLDVLENGLNESISAAQKMSWAANRQTTRREDMAYCLLGLFGINMPLLYGEGGKAFVRLQEEIIKHSDDHSLFLWLDDEGTDSTYSGLLAKSPKEFSSCSRCLRWPSFPLDDSPYSITNTGLQLNVLLLPISGSELYGRRWIDRIFPPVKLEPEEELYVPLLNCSSNFIPCSIFLKRLDRHKSQFARVMTHRRITLRSKALAEVIRKDSLSTIFIRQ